MMFVGTIRVERRQQEVLIVVFDVFDTPKYFILKLGVSWKITSHFSERR